MEETFRNHTLLQPKTVWAQHVVTCRPYCIVCLCNSGLFVCCPDVLQAPQDCTSIQYLPSNFPPGVDTDAFEDSANLQFYIISI